MESEVSSKEGSLSETNQKSNPRQSSLIQGDPHIIRPDLNIPEPTKTETNTKNKCFPLYVYIHSIMIFSFNFEFRGQRHGKIYNTFGLKANCIWYTQTYMYTVYTERPYTHTQTPYLHSTVRSISCGCLTPDMKYVFVSITSIDLASREEIVEVM